jgi:hypothetical protein
LIKPVPLLPHAEEDARDIQTMEAPKKEDIQPMEALKKEDIQTKEALKKEDIQTMEAPKKEDIQTMEALKKEEDLEDLRALKEAREKVDAIKHFLF